MHTINERPRELRWYHAAGLLFGDWGTSRLYVLGLAFVMSGHASFWYVAAMCTLVVVVGFAYTIICTHFPDGGGVYSAAKKRSRTVAVVGALLLTADYTITAALSSYVGFRYMELSPTAALYAAIVALAAMGAMNIIGPRRIGLLAIVVAVLAAGFYLIIGLFCLKAGGQATIHRPDESLGLQWSHFVNVVLALSGVEAIANMTGVMAEPVAKNARKAILIVLAEVVILNLITAYAMNSFPSHPEIVQVGGRDTVVHAINGYDFTDTRDHMLKIVANELTGEWFSWIASICFGFLLLSAANTAIGGIISIQYLLGRDRELPQKFTLLNSFGVPWMGLITATLAPITVLLIVGSDTEALAGLYAMGVVGAITINMAACGTNRDLDLKKWERFVLIAVGSLAACIELTIAYEKPMALLFACIVVGLGLTARHAAKRAAVRAPAEGEAAKAKTPSERIGPERMTIAMSKSRLLMPTRGGPKLMKFAVSYAKDKNAALFVLFVREVAVAFRERGEKVGAETMTLADDSEALRIFDEAKKMCDAAGVPMVKLYAVHDSPAEMILDHAATLGVDAVLMGVSKRGALWKTLRGDVLQEVITYLPETIPLLIHA